MALITLTMLWRLANLGVLSLRSHDTMAGNLTCNLWSPWSISLVICNTPSMYSIYSHDCQLVTFEANVANEISLIAARSWAVWLESSSIAFARYHWYTCFPRRIISYLYISLIFLRILATDNGCSSWSILMSVVMWIPLSAPIARAALRVSAALNGQLGYSHVLSPIVIAVISFTCPFSFSFIASSTAISQNGLIDIFKPLSSTLVFSGLTLTYGNKLNAWP